eukprot:3675339-Rhodomonas_salina.1
MSGTDGAYGAARCSFRRFRTLRRCGSRTPLPRFQLRYPPTHPLAHPRHYRGVCPMPSAVLTWQSPMPCAVLPWPLPCTVCGTCVTYGATRARASVVLTQHMVLPAADDGHAP